MKDKKYTIEDALKDLQQLDEDMEETFDLRFDEKFGTGTDVFSADEYLKRMKEMREFK